LIDTLFDTKTIPGISVTDYLMRLQEYFQCSDSCFVFALLYIDRVLTKHKKIHVTLYNIHRLYLAALVISVKFYEDEYFPNEYYAEIGGITRPEINKLEAEFLKLLNYKLIISSEFYDKYIKIMETYYKKFMTSESGKFQKTRADDSDSTQGDPDFVES